MPCKPAGMQQLSAASTPRQRASHIGHIHNRAARLAVRDIQQHLNEWQHTAATLRAAQFHSRNDPSDASARAAEMLPLVVADRIELEARLDGLETAVATHSLTRDIRRALDRLHADLQQLIID